MVVFGSRIGMICVSAMFVGAAPASTFRDCADCPEMIAVPAGNFMMGSPASEPGRFDDEGPQHRVTIQPTAVSATPITRAQYAMFANATNRADPDSCVAMNDAGEFKLQPGLNWRNPGFEQTPDHPVVCVSWEDAVAYIAWLSARTGKNYGLLTEAEFEYAARGGSPTRHWWGEESGNTTCTFANGFDLAAKRTHPDWPSIECDDRYPFTSPVRTFPANGFGLFDMAGNAFSWVQDCYVEGYAGAPADGSARIEATCPARAIRGGSWLNSAKGLRAALRDRDPPKGRYQNLGFRVARDM
jgi:formylglycine-generating enzyme